jgi:uncharacterized protein (DUF697 family)/GTP-binding protein EngB required for normal cell division
MALSLQRPILVGGLGLSVSLWLLQSWDDSYVHHAHLGEFGILGAIAVGGGLWLLKQNNSTNNSSQSDGSPVNRATVEAAISQVEAVVNQLAQEAENHQALATLRSKVTQLQAELDRKDIKIAVTGGKLVGKTTLINLLQNVESFPEKSLTFQETAALFTEAGETSDTTALAEANQSDLVLFVTNGDLTETEFQVIQQFKARNQRTLLVFNKQDQYLPDERAAVLLSLRQRLPGSVVGAAAAPNPIKVRKFEADGSAQEWMEQPAPDMQQINQYLSEILELEAPQLVLATTMRATLALKAEAKDLLNSVRRDRALPIVEQYQWIAAAAAFANPVPALDLLATAAITAQMVMDLGGIYQQKFSLDQAKTVAGEMGGLMLKLGLVELSTKAIGTVLKSNAVTYVAGGLVQGVSAAYLTRVAGLSLIEYFQQQEVAGDTGFNLEKFGQTLQNVFQQTQQLGALQGFVKQGVKKLLPEAQPEAVV